MAVAGRVGADVGERLFRVGRPVPHHVIDAAAHRRVVVAARHRVSEELLALRQAEHVALEDFRVDCRRNVALVEHGAPGDVAGIARLQFGHELFAHGRAEAVGADQQVALRLRAVGEMRGDAARVLRHALERLVEVVARGRQRGLERGVDARPRAHDAVGRALDERPAGAVENDKRRDAHAHRIVESDAEALHDLVQLRVRRDAGAAADEAFRVALIDDGVPAGAAQQVGGEQAADRAADHDCAPCAHEVDTLGRDSLFGQRIDFALHSRSLRRHGWRAGAWCRHPSDSDFARGYQLANAPRCGA